MLYLGPALSLPSEIWEEMLYLSRSLIAYNHRAREKKLT